MKPIEEGCLAIMTAAKPGFQQHIGRVFTVGQYCTEYAAVKCLHCNQHGRFWIILPNISLNPNKANTATCACSLRRIDDHDPDSMDLAIIEQLKPKPAGKTLKWRRPVKA